MKAEGTDHGKRRSGAEPRYERSCVSINEQSGKILNVGFAITVAVGSGPISEETQL